jgi:hypothetical protein
MLGGALLLGWRLFFVLFYCCSLPKYLKCTAHPCTQQKNQKFKKRTGCRACTGCAWSMTPRGGV